jgi:FkbM family methyltransferase
MHKMIGAYTAAVENMVIMEQCITAWRNKLDGCGFDGHPDQAFGHLTFAQHGEDLLFVNFFHLLGIQTPTWLDIGAHHPVNISNTALLYKRGGHGVNVEANPNLIGNFVEQRPRDTNVNVGVAPKSRAGGTMTFYMIDEYSGRNTFDRKAAEEFVAQHPEFSIKAQKEIDVISIDQVVERYCGGKYPDLLTMDVENLDYDILASADFSRSKPKLICVEVVSSGGDTSSEMKELITNHGYFVAARTIGNYIFAENSLRDRLA